MESRRRIRCRITPALRSDLLRGAWEAAGGIRPRAGRDRLEQREGDIIPSKVFVGNLAFDTTQGELETLFSEAGRLVEVFIPSDRATGRPRGFAFVEFADEAGVSAAIEKFDGKELKGRTIRVSKAEDRPRRPNPSMGFDLSGDGPGGPRWEKPKGSRRNIRGKKRSL